MEEVWKIEIRIKGERPKVEELAEQILDLVPPGANKGVSITGVLVLSEEPIQPKEVSHGKKA